MPLRAKILNPAFSQREMSSGAQEQGANATKLREKARKLEPDDVLFGSNYGVRTIELNRPAKLNSLNWSMAAKIAPRLIEWEKSQLANIVVIKGAGEKAFCAGGDVGLLAQLNKAGAAGVRESVDFFGLEYRLDHLIATYPKPYVAFLDGITMGGGVGLSVHAPFRIATERTMFAMPETTIGFFPDVGGSFFLPRLDGELGTYLALTSERMLGVHTMYAGIATHYVHSSSLPDLEARLAELTFPDATTLERRNEIVNSTIEEFVTGLPSNEPFVLGGDLRRAIDRCFRFDSVDDILTALRSENTEWAQKTIETLHARSPTSVRVTLRQLRLGRHWSIAETFQREHLIAARFMEHQDFVEGVEAQLGRAKALKRGEEPPVPLWHPPTLEECTDDVAEEFFRLPEGVERLKLLRGDGPDYNRYPHERFGLPSEAWLEHYIRSHHVTRRELVMRVVEEYEGKAGVKEKVNDVVERRCGKDENGFVVWN